MRNDANYDDENPGNTSQPDESERTPDQAVTQGRDVHDVSREGATQGADVLENEAESEVETYGRTVIDRSRATETHGVDVIDEGPRSDSSDEDTDH
jgi:hypothetical protein